MMVLLYEIIYILTTKKYINSMKDKIIPVILAGGSGTRLWPMSRTSQPKQFNEFKDGLSLFQFTLLRAKKISKSIPVVVTNKTQQFLALQQSKDLNIDIKVLIEPAAKNTAPAILLSALYIDRTFGNSNIVVLSADHVMDDNFFIESVGDNISSVNNSNIVVFGVTPTYPEIGYGYIEYQEQAGSINKVISFKEKPSIDLAKSYIDRGNYLWNAGIFLFSSDSLQKNMLEYSPEISKFCIEAIKQTDFMTNIIHVFEENFSNCPSDSIDFAVIEKMNEIYVVDIGSSWNDVGTWRNYKKAFPQNEEGNVGDEGVIFKNAKENFVKSSSTKVICLLGVDNLAVIDMPDALLIADINKSQEIKEVVEDLQKKSSEVVTNHRKVYRPWGWYDSLDFGLRDQVKRISVRPGERLSLQKHAHRSEHWVVVKGIATVTINEIVKDIHPNESVYINVGDVHRLENKTSEPVEIIEVQVGDYLGEDDIVRLEDIYGRA